jgi:threonine/homoserine/homoserine lactone efflux protein
MKAPTAVILLLVLGSLIFAAGFSAKVWRREEWRYRVLSVLVGLLLIIMATLVLLGVIESASD